MDVLSLPRTRKGNRYIVVFVDYLTKWYEAFATLDHEATTIAELLIKHVVCRHGVLEMLSDRGVDFLPGLLTEICQLLAMKKINTTAYHPKRTERNAGETHGISW